MKRMSMLLIASCLTFSSAAVAQSLLIPYPQNVETGLGGKLKIDNETCLTIMAPKEDANKIEKLFRREGLKLQITEAKAPKRNAIILKIVDKLANSNKAEAYSLKVNKNIATIEATSGAGLFYGAQSLINLYKEGKGRIESENINDAPRLDYRGLMIDVSRHFFGIDFLKKQIDQMAKVKLNRLHLHLTDAAGWRLEIKKYPRLTEFGAWRDQALWKSWWNGERKYVEEGTNGAYGGFFTQEQIKDLLEYAADRYITIIPEIEMPAHSEEVLTAYPSLSCTHVPYKQADFCIGNDSTFIFLQDVLDEVIELFPSEYIHIGGDEAGKESWPKCELCQKRMKDENLNGVEELQSYLIHRIETYLNSKGRKLLGWDEILEGGLAPNATVMSWRGEDGGLKAVESGHKAIMTPGEFCYFDQYQDAPYSLPEAIGGYLPLEKVYQYNPISPLIDESKKDLIYGVQANMWAEYIPNEKHAEMMLWPRALALSEIAWTQPENKDWKRFRKAAEFAVEEMEANGYSPFSLKKEIGNRPETLKKLKHQAVGKHVTYNGARYADKYSAGGDSALIDDVYGGWTYTDKRWQGFINGNTPIDVTIDLGKITNIEKVKATFMQACGPWVFFPSKISIMTSEDGTNYSEVFNKSYDEKKTDTIEFENRGWEGKAKARYVRFVAYKSKFDGWLFTDEIVIE